ncbi:MAG: hypothetical protein ACRDIV_06155 [Ktedonobacteraceae bacterium]
MKEQEVERLLQRIKHNCEAIARIMDEPHYPDAGRAINRRVQAFAIREEQLMWLVGGRQSHYMAFRMFSEAIKIQ